MDKHLKKIIEKNISKFSWWNDLPSEWQEFYLKYVDFENNSNIKIKYRDTYPMFINTPIKTFFTQWEAIENSETKIVYDESVMLSIFERLTKIKKLNLTGFELIPHKEYLSPLIKLEKFKYNFPLIETDRYFDDIGREVPVYAEFDLNALSDLTSLKNITVSNCNISDSTIFNNLSKLKKLILRNSGISNTQFLKSLRNLQYLDLSVNIEIVNISMIRNLTNLEYLDLSETNSINLKPLSRLKNLKSLKLKGVRNRNMENFRESSFLDLDVSDEEYERIYGWRLDISPLSSLKNLEYLDLSETDVQDFSPLTNLKKLKYIDLSYMRLMDIDPIAKIDNLEILNFYEVTGLTDNQFEKFIKRNKHLTINYSQGDEDIVLPF